ncbi:unnamed protein product [Ectocarpus sp. CCAP 1310/34]|nr:unnamed protein product [Ectocarpus sp. CCAP 1310/34]
MGLASSPGWFQGIMSRVCEGLERCMLFIDDIVIFSKGGKEHVVDMTHFFERVKRCNLNLAPKKTCLGVKVVKFLGHEVTVKGLKPDPAKVASLQRIPMPTNVSQLRSLLVGLSYYYRSFLPNMAAQTRPLNNLLKKGTKFVFGTEHVEIVQRLMDKLSSPNVLAYRDAISGVRKFRVITDASQDGLGAVIEQDQPDGTTRPLCFLRTVDLLFLTRSSGHQRNLNVVLWSGR